jgi:hypothetical protein
MRRLGAIAGAVTVLVLGTAVVQAAIPDEDGYTYICVNKSSGAILAREKGASCPKNSTPSRLVANQNAINLSTYRKNVSITIPAASIAGETVECDNEGDLATGGGFSSINDDLVILDSLPVPFEAPTTGWHFRARNTHPTLGSNAQVWVVCMTQ